MGVDSLVRWLGDSPIPRMPARIGTFDPVAVLGLPCCIVLRWCVICKQSVKNSVTGKELHFGMLNTKPESLNGP